MNELIIEDIHEIRSILDSFEKSDFDESTSFYHSCGFPKGCCGDTSDLLGIFLKWKFGKDVEYVSATGLGDNTDLSHAWLVLDGSVIDITADQFNYLGYNIAPVVITENSNFHSQFNDYERKSINVDELKSTGVYTVFTKVLERLKS